MGLGIRGWRRVGLCLCKVGGVGSRSNSAPWILCSAVRTISIGLVVWLGKNWVCDKMAKGANRMLNDYK